MDGSIFDRLGILVHQPVEHGKVLVGVDDGSAQLNTSVGNP